MYDINKTTFKYPIEYLNNVKTLCNNINEDLELIETKNKESEPILKTIYNPQTCYGEHFLDRSCKYYTSDKDFLTDSQTMLVTFSKTHNIDVVSLKKTTDDMNEMWTTIKNDHSFLENFYYIEYDYFKFLNKSSSFLQILSTYNLLSPILTLIMPILMLIVPFFLLKMKNIPITLDMYFTILKTLLKQNPIFKLFSLDAGISINARLYALFSCLFYCFSIYNNANSCYRFYKNFNKMHGDIKKLKKYIETTLNNIDLYLKIITPFPSYSSFIHNLQEHKKYLSKKLNSLHEINSVNYNPKKIAQIGYVMKIYYEFYNDEMLDQEILYSFGFNGYIDQLIGLGKRYINKEVNICKYTNKNKIKQMYYPALITNTAIKNDITFKKNIIITGPNASGKTTILKTALINILLSQTYGVGFYKSASITLYDYLHCYLNIPDTSGRDSLFQAEARRCKEILTEIHRTPGAKHFCIFDELYSGTNPYEAIASANSFINYLSKQKVSFLLTTHYIKLCEIKNKNIVNYYMLTRPLENYNFKYLYLLKKGISKIKGGLKVLIDLDYPKEILENAHLTLTKM